jgi:cell division protein FtsW
MIKSQKIESPKDFYGPALLIFTLFLLCVSFLEVFSSSSIKGESMYKDYAFFIKKHALGFVLSLVVFAAVNAFHRFPYKKLAPLLMWATLGCLALVFVPGLYIESGGAKRWLNLFVFRVQTSELTKVSFLFFLAYVFSKSSFDINNLRSKIPPIVMFGLLTLFLLVQPDFGTSFILLFLLLLMFFVAGASRQFLFFSGAVSLVGVAYLVISAPYRFKRILAFADPWENFRSSGFQIIQSMLAFRNGAAFGSGLGSSKQKLYFLPEAHTDFIGAVIAEELGAFGVITVMMALYGIFYCAYRISIQQKDAFHRYVCFGASFLFFIHVVLNISMCVGISPPKGLTLPFLSYGISSQIVFSFLISYLYMRSWSEHDSFEKVRLHE